MNDWQNQNEPRKYFDKIMGGKAPATVKPKKTQIEVSKSFFTADGKTTDEVKIILNIDHENKSFNILPYPGGAEEGFFFIGNTQNEVNGSFNRSNMWLAVADCIKTAVYYAEHVLLGNVGIYQDGTPQGENYDPRPQFDPEFWMENKSKPENP